jgi:hypothetical protein
MSDFTPLQLQVLKAVIPADFFSDLYWEEGMVEDFASGDRLWVVGSEVQVIKYGDRWQQGNGEFKVLPRSEYNYPLSEFTKAAKHFCAGW